VIKIARSGAFRVVVSYNVATDGFDVHAARTDPDGRAQAALGLDDQGAIAGRLTSGLVMGPTNALFHARETDLLRALCQGLIDAGFGPALPDALPPVATHLEDAKATRDRLFTLVEKLTERKR
jgi:hypothetical protein